MSLTNLVHLFSDVTIPFQISDGSKDVSLKIILFNKNQLTHFQEEQPSAIKIPQMIIRMNKNSYGQFEADVSLKAVVKALYSNKISAKKANQEEEREGDCERQMYESLKQSMKSIHFIFETDHKCLRTDRFWSIKQTANCLGPVAFHALGGLKQVNERNVELEVQQMMMPLMKKLEIENNFKGNKVIKIADDVVSETDSTTQNSDVSSHITSDEHHQLLNQSFAQSDAEIMSVNTENEIENVKVDIKSAVKRPEVPKQFQNSSNKWQNKRN